MCCYYSGDCWVGKVCRWLRLPMVCRKYFENTRTELVEMSGFMTDRMVAAERVCRENNLNIPRVPHPWFPNDEATG